MFLISLKINNKHSVKFSSLRLLFLYKLLAMVLCVNIPIYPIDITVVTDYFTLHGEPGFK